MDNANNKKPTLKDSLVCAVFILFIGVFFALNIVLPPPAILVAERRIPAKLPELTANSVFSGSYMTRFEDYAADRFVFRDFFRAIHSYMVFDLYMQRDISGLYRSQAVGLGEFKATDASAFRLSAQKINNAAKSLSELDMNIYYSLIPDKSIYAEFYMPGFDLELAQDILYDVLADYTYIDIAGILDADVYYKTDLHWDQRKISPVVDHLLLSMGNSAGNIEHSKNDYEEFGSPGVFHGLYVGQLALPYAADVLSYVDLNNLTVSYMNDKTLEFESGPVYDFQRFSGIDPYDFFLRGPQPLIVIENEAAPQRELYLFRDSFGSSLAPLLSCSYSKITVIDLRYINLSLLDMFISFTPDSDVLFIYGSQILNNPSILQA